MLAAGTKLGSYEILSLLGKGGMGEVYRARDTKLRREVALKILPNDLVRVQEALPRLEREAAGLAALNHPNVAIIHALEASGDESFLVMELVEGDTLAERLRRGPLSHDEALPIAVALCDALDAIHRAGYVHRDLKPANIKVTPAGVVKILDFGLAKLLWNEAQSELPTEAVLTGNGTLLGTAAYMSPEQLQGQVVTPRSDIYALGIVLFEMITGKRPFDADSTIAVALKRLLAPAPSPRIHRRDVDETWETTILRCLERDPERRFGEALDVAAALRGSHLTRPAVRRSRRRIAVAAALLAVTGLVGYLSSVPLRRTPTPDTTLSAVTAAPMRRSVAVMGFRNVTGQPDTAWLSTALAEMLTTELASTDAVRAVAGEDVARTKLELQLADADAFARDTLERVGANLGADLIVVGSYVALRGEGNRLLSMCGCRTRGQARPSRRSARPAPRQTCWS